MSYNSIRTIVSTVAGVILIAAYIIYALGTNSPAPENLRSWATAILVFIGIGVAALIVIQVLFHIALAIGIAVKERERDDKTVERIISSSMVEDERDKIISLRSSHVGYICVGTGFIAALVALASGMAYVVALHVLSGAFAVGSIIEGIVSVYYYEKGVRNG
jgi:ABC-type multidrug transport system permease subunit